jgi:acyl-coenzyme A synthetase/AMP-(fatty) acid ligase
MQPPAQACTSRFIAWHATHTPDSPAIVEDDVVITYRTLATDLVRCGGAAVEIDISPPPLDAMQRIGAILASWIGSFVIMPVRRFPRTESGKIKRQEIGATFRQCQPHELITVR